VDRSHLIAAERAFILPVVIDGVREADALVPDRFREVQWTFCPEGRVSAEFVARWRSCSRRMLLRLGLKLLGRQ
jgi:hypothetical protein